MAIGVESKVSLKRARARLLLYAVLPALADFVDTVPEAAALLPEGGLRVAFCAPDGLRQVLHLNRAGGSRYAGDLPSDITLRFLSSAQAEAQLLGKPTLPPLPLRGLTQFAALRTLTQLTDMLQTYLRAPADLSSQSTAFLHAHVELSLAVALRAVCELCDRDPAVSKTIAKAPTGTICFTIGRSANAADEVRTEQARQLQLLWLRFEGGRAQYGIARGSSMPQADAHLHFADLSVAAGVLRNAVDTQAAIGTGRLVIRGLVPLADAAGAVLDTLKQYLPVDEAV